MSPDPAAEVWGVLHGNTHAAPLHLDRAEGVPGRRYRCLWIDAEDIEGRRLKVTYIADGKEPDGNPSLHCLRVLREGARVRALPERWIRLLESVKHAR